MSWLSIILANLPAEINGVVAIINYIANLRKAAQQASIWTPADEQAFIDLLVRSFDLKQWKTDAELASGAPPKP